MKFSCYKSDLTEALQFVIRAVAVKPMTPILAGIYMRAEGSTLELQANNYSTGIITRIPVNTENPGETVVSGKRLQEFVRNMPDETITFDDEKTRNSLSIESGGATIELLTMTVEDFPKVKTPEINNSFRIRTTALRNLIRKTIFSVSKDDTRPVFTGGFFEIKGDKISIVTTNTHRLALAAEQLSEPYDEFSFVVPADTLRGLMMRIDPQDAENYVTIDCSDRHLVFKFDNVVMTSRLIEGFFPPYNKVIPSSSTTRITIDVEEFKQALELVALMTKGTENNTVRFNISSDGVEISSNSPDVGDAVKNVEAIFDGEELGISFNADYILEALRVIDSKQVKIAFNDRYSPADFREPDNKNYVYVVTPVRA